MSIALECPACGRRYQLKSELAGKRAACKCGHAMTVPDADEGAAVDLDGLPALPAAPTPAAGTTSDAPADPPATDAFRSWGGPVPGSPITGSGPQRPRRKRQESGMRVPIAILSIVYGAGLIAWEGLWTLLTFDLLSLNFITVGLAGVLVAGGVLLLKNHRAAPGTTGLSCLLATFWPAYLALDTGVALLGVYFSPWGLLYLLLGLALTAVAGVIITWCVREEKRRDRTSNLPPI